MSNTPLNADDRTYDCRECGKLVVANEYHPYLYCQLQKAGLLNDVLADRKKHELQARIDEINYLDDNFQVDSQDWEREHPGYSTAMIPMEDYIRRRTELKAQQELEKL